MKVDLILEEMAKTYRDRNAEYGSNWNLAAELMLLFFPEGITLKTKDDFIRFGILEHIVNKLTRFINSKMTHADSVHDGAVYMAIMEALLRETKT